MNDDESDDPFEQFLRPKKVEEFHAQEQTAVPGAVRQSLRSAADDVIDLLGGIKKPTKHVLCCPNCKGTDFVKRTPLTSAPVNQCTKCGTKLYGVARSSAWMRGDSTQHSQGPGGAYYRGQDSPPPRETHAPAFRAKGRPFPTEES